MLRKETYGMQYDRAYYEMIVNKIEDGFKNVFGKEICFIEKKCSFEHMGYFKMNYKYLPLQYDIIFENERNLFNIRIQDYEGAFNHLNAIEEYEGQLTLENIQGALLKLKKVLEANDMCFYIYKGDKLYKKKGQEYKRIKDLSEITGR